MKRDLSVTIPSTARVEAFSDGVIAIILTLLILEIKVPHIEDNSAASLFISLKPLLPKFFSFTFSFITLATFWVNHHHFFHQIKHIDWKLLWYNILLLFWLCVIPFTTALAGENIEKNLVISLYALNMFLAASSFAMMWRYAFVAADMIKYTMTQEEKQREFRRVMLAVIFYGIAAAAALFFVFLALAILLLILFVYFIPKASGAKEA